MDKMQKRNTDLWFTELQTPNLKLGLKIKGILRNIQTEYQNLIVVDSLEYGKVLALDGAIQLTEKDEFCYHEMMAHIPICAHPTPQRVLIIGGGDGGILRECLKHDIVESVTLVDIDGQVIQASKDFFPTVSSAMNDNRAEILVMDAIQYIKDHKDHFDVVIIDSTDPVEFAAGLFESPFYRDVFESLTDKGFVIAQTESPFAEEKLLKDAISEMRKVFPIVSVCLGYMPTYPTGMWTYTVGSKHYNPAEAIGKNIEGKTKYYSREMHKASFVLPPFVEKIVLDGENH